MVKVDIQAKPLTEIEPDCLAVMLFLTEKPDTMWRAIFEARAGAEDPSFRLREAVADGSDVVAMTLRWSMTDDDARARVQRLITLVDEVEAEHSARWAKLRHLESVVGAMVR
ncbi:MAG: hypothetical protein ABSF89_17675 [Acidimicrobiales bacterium]|jgi:hypothetical protein